VVAVTERKGSVLLDLGAESPWVRATAASLLGAVPSLHDEMFPQLEKCFEQETHPFVRASLLSSLEMLDRTEKWKTTIAKIAKDGDSNPLVWGVAALSWLRDKPEHHLVDILPAVEAWLNLELEKLDFLMWQHLVVSNQCTVLTWVLKRRGIENRDDTLDALVALGRAAKKQRLVEHLGIVISQYFDRPESPLGDRVILARELTPEMRRVAEGLVDSWVYPAASWMPACGSCRRRWLGIDPPSVLEKCIPMDAGDTDSRPLWEVWRELEPQRQPTELLPPKLASVLAPAEKWRAAVDYHLRSYGSGGNVDWSTLTDTGQTMTVDDQLEAVILSLCQEALIRQEHASWVPKRHPVVSRLLLLPLVRAGRHIPENLYALVRPENEKEEREIMAALPQKALAEILERDLQTLIVRYSTKMALTLLNLLEMAPVPTVCDKMVHLASMVPDDASHTDFHESFRRTLQHLPELMAAFERRKPSADQ
jgi:hypothetical protein